MGCNSLFRRGGRVCDTGSTLFGNPRVVSAVRPRPRRAASGGGVRRGGVPVRWRGARGFGAEAGVRRPCAAAKGCGTNVPTSLFPGHSNGRSNGRSNCRRFEVNLCPIGGAFAKGCDEIFVMGACPHGDGAITDGLQTICDDIRTIYGRFATIYGRFATICGRSTGDLRRFTDDLRRLTDDLRAICYDLRTICDDLRTICDDLRTIYGRFATIYGRFTGNLRRIAADLRAIYGQFTGNSNGRSNGRSNAGRRRPAAEGRPLKKSR